MSYHIICHITSYHSLSWTANVMFSFLLFGWFVSLDVGLCVCLLTTLWKNWGTPFHEIYRIYWTWHRQQCGTFCECSVQTLPYRTFFRGNPCLIATLRRNGFSCNFHDRSDMRQGTIWNILRMLCHILGRRINFQFSGSVFASNIMKKQIKGFPWNFQDKLDTRKARLFPAQLDCFAVDPQASRAVMPTSNIKEVSKPYTITYRGS